MVPSAPNSLRGLPTAARFAQWKFKYIFGLFKWLFVYFHFQICSLASLASESLELRWIIRFSSKIFLFIMYFKGLILKFPQMRWAPTCNNREASGMAYGEYEDDFWSKRARLFLKSRPAAWWAATCSRQAYTHSLLHTHRRPFQATFLSSIFFQTGDKKLQQPFPILHLHGENFAYRHLESCTW